MANNAATLDSNQLPTGNNLAKVHARSKVITPHTHLNGQAHNRIGIPCIDSLVQLFP